MEWLGQVLAQNAPVVVLICVVWYQLNNKLQSFGERLAVVETKVGVKHAAKS